MILFSWMTEHKILAPIIVFVSVLLVIMGIVKIIKTGIISATAYILIVGCWGLGLLVIDCWSINCWHTAYVEVIQAKSLFFSDKAYNVKGGEKKLVLEKSRIPSAKERTFPVGTTFISVYSPEDEYILFKNDFIGRCYTKKEKLILYPEKDKAAIQKQIDLIKIKTHIPNIFYGIGEKLFCICPLGVEMR